MSSFHGITGAMTRATERAEQSSSTRAPDAPGASASTPFAALLGAALTTRPAARPLTQPDAAGATVETAGAQEPAYDSLPALGTRLTLTDDTSVEGDPRSTTELAQVDANGVMTAAASQATVEGAAGNAGEESEVAATSEATAESNAAEGPPATTAVNRELDWLVPEMRERLVRVLDRMRNEHGHDVRVSETYRSQARQDALHAQGRSRPGPVVTWTRNSNHTQGRAADIVVNGGYDDMQAYATLQRVAREEGLHTLGMRDPGHVELPKNVKGTLEGARPGMVDLADVSRIAPDARVRVTEVSVQSAPAQAAGVARVAQVAAVAPVAPVAQPARPAAVARVASVANVATPGAAVAPADASTAAVAGAGARRGDTNGDSRDGRGTEQGSTEGGYASTDGSQGERLHGAHVGVDATRGGGASRAEPVHVAAGADALARMDAIAALRDGAAARPLSHLTLTVDDGAGGADRIRVDARGGTVGVTLDLSDAAAADRLGSRIGELQQALEQRGLETDALRVRSGAAQVPESIEMGRVAAGTLERESARSGNQGTQQHAQQQGQQDHGAARDRDGRGTHDDQRRDQSSRQRFRQPDKETDK